MLCPLASSPHNPTSPIPQTGYYTTGLTLLNFPQRRFVTKQTVRYEGLELMKLNLRFHRLGILLLKAYFLRE